MTSEADIRTERRRTFATWIGLIMPFTPIGKEGGLKRPPWAVIGLIVANLVIHFFAWPMEKADQAVLGMRAGQLSAIEAVIEHRFLGLDAGPWGVSSRFRGRSAFEEKFWARFEAGQVVPVDDPDYIDWDRAHDLYLAAEEDRLFYRWGTHSENQNIVSWISSMFLHAGFFHIFGNMFLLWVAGGALEDVWGPRLVLLLYFVAGLLAQVPDAFFLPPRDIPGIGASGAVAGLMGAFLIKMHAEKLRFVILPMLPTVVLPGWVFFLPWAIFEVRNAMSGVFTGVAHWVHVGGFLGGALVAGIYRWRGVEAVAKVSLDRIDANTRRKKRESLEAIAVDLERRGQFKESIDQLILACKADLGMHQTLRTTLDRLMNAFDRKRALQISRETMQFLWDEHRKDEHAQVFTLVRGHGLQDELPSIELLHGADSLAPANPREAAETLHAFLTARLGDPLAKAAMNRYADLLDRLGNPEGAKQARAQAAAIKPKRS